MNDKDLDEILDQVIFIQSEYNHTRHDYEEAKAAINAWHTRTMQAQMLELIGNHQDGCIALNQYSYYHDSNFKEEDCDCGVRELRQKLSQYGDSSTPLLSDIESWHERYSGEVFCPFCGVPSGKVKTNGGGFYRCKGNCKNCFFLMRSTNESVGGSDEGN
jgi:hypothetical protein